MALRYPLDSVIAIEHFNGIEAAATFLSEHGTEGAFTVITRADVHAGFSVEAEPLTLELLDAFVTLPLTIETAALAARLRLTKRWKLPDAFQAAIAISNNLIRATRNTRDFQPGGKPDVLIPYRL